MKHFPHILFWLLCISTFTTAQPVFKKAVSLPFTNGAYYSSFGDIDGDQDVDVVFTTMFKSTLFVAYNDPKGAFSKIDTLFVTPANFLGSYPMPFALADMTGDGRLDIVVVELADPEAKELGIYSFANGKFSRTFGIPTTETVTPSRLVAGDFNKDGKQDILAIGSRLVKYEAGTSVFSKKVIATPNITPFDMSVHDLNKDGNLDLVIQDYGFKVGLFKGSASGDFSFDQFLTASDLVYDFEINDFTGDQLPDILCMSGSLHQFDLFAQSANGTFTKQTVPRTGDGGQNLASGDIDHDGDIDLVYQCTQLVGVTQSGFMIMKNTGSSYTESFVQTITGNTNEISLGDIDGDDKLDILPLHASGFLGIYKDVGGTYTQAITFRYAVNEPYNTILADLNLDGKDDLICANHAALSVSVQYNTGGPSVFGPPQHFAFTLPPTQLKIADFNNDGFPDILSRPQQIPGISPGFSALGLILSNSEGKLTTVVDRIQFTSPFVSNVGDFNADGNMDILNESAAFFGNGDGTFTDYQVDNLGQTFSNAVADLNNDGFDDIVKATGSGLSIFYGKNERAMTTGPNLILGTYAVEMITADFDGDHFPEIITNDLNSKQFTVSKRGASGLYTENVVPTDLPVRTFSAGDYDKDGDLDFVILSYADQSNQLVSYTNNSGSLEFTSSKKLNIYSSYSHILTGNLNGDSFPDLLLWNIGAANIVLYNDGIEEPTINPTSVTVTDVTDKSAKISVTPGNGSHRLIVVSELDLDSPLDNTTYVANTTFGDGTKIGASTFAVMASKDVFVTVTGLNKKTTYKYAVYEYNQNDSKSETAYLINDASPKGQFSTKDTQSITFTIADQTQGGADLTLNATATSGLPIVYEVISGNVSITGATLKINGPGPAKVKAFQAGSNEVTSAFAEAPFCVNPLKPAVTVTDQGGGKFLLTSSSETNNTWYVDGNPVANATDKTLQPTIDGVYSVRVSYGSCVSASEPTAYLITGLSEAIAEVSITPNPATKSIFIKTTGYETEGYEPVIYDVTGRAFVSQVTNRADAIELNVSDLSAGLYFLKVRQGQVFKFLKE